MTRASVVINNYNYGRFLAEAIDSALAQTYPQAEVIVVDDGSTDNSPEVIAQYGDRIIPMLKENGGQGSALNTGFATSTGDVVIFLDADDVLLPSALDAVVPVCEDPEVVQVHWRMPMIDVAGRRTGDVTEPDIGGGDFREEVRRYGPQSDATPVSAPTSGNAWSRRFLKQIMPMPEDTYLWGADTYLFALAPAFGRIVVLEESQSLYRLHGANDHMGRSFAETLAAAYVDLEVVPEVAARPYRQAGIEIDVDQWRRHSWWGRVHDAVNGIMELVSDHATFLLADQDAWGTDADFFGRRRVPFPEQEGEYGGVPEDDAEAIAEVERWRERGAAAICFAWPAHWWLDHFEGLVQHLERRYPCLRRDELLVVFDLNGDRRSGAPGS